MLMVLISEDFNLHIQIKSTRLLSVKYLVKALLLRYNGNNFYVNSSYMTAKFRLALL